MTDVDDYMTMLRESQLKRTIVIEDVDKIIFENKQLKELLKEIRDSIYESQLKLTPEGFKLITEIVAKIDEVLNG